MAEFARPIRKRKDALTAVPSGDINGVRGSNPSLMVEPTDDASDGSNAFGRSETSVKSIKRQAIVQPERTPDLVIYVGAYRDGDVLHWQIESEG